MSNTIAFTYDTQYRLIRDHKDPVTDQWRSEDAAFEHLLDLTSSAALEDLTQDALDETASTMVSDRDWLRHGSYCVEATVTKFNQEGRSWSLDELTRRSAYVEVEAAVDA